MFANYTVQDIFSASLAFFLFPLVFVFPGFVFGWLLNIFEIKQRSVLMQLGIGVILSFSISPILVFLCWRLVSFEFTLAVLLAFFVIFCLIFIKLSLANQRKSLPKDAHIALSLAAVWILLAMLSLVDMQIGSHLYYSIVSLDYTTRVAVTDAISRSGLPPSNPSYFPGEPVQLTSLYYFWYVLVSLIAKIGQGIIDGRTALIASVLWAGLGLMALISVYLRLRAPNNFHKPWRLALIGIGSLAIGGLDILPILVMIITSWLVLGKFYFDGGIEHWNEQIATWLTSVFWDPHHVASLIACVTSLLLVQFVARRPRPAQIAAMSIAGLGFASAFGLSTWTTLVFCAFWGIWFVYQFVFEKNYALALLMFLSGIVALTAAYPFISDLLGGVDSSDGFPLILSVRRFNLVLPITLPLLPVWRELIHFLLLPMNYLLELGYFFLIAFVWLKQSGPRAFRTNPYQAAEIFLLATTVLLASFVKSTVGNNDFGWRAWLFGQFVLLVWSADILIELLNGKPSTSPKMILKILAKKQPLLALFLLIGLLTTFSNALFLRTWPLAIEANLTNLDDIPRDSNLGQRAFAAKQAYGFISDHVPLAAIIQTNPNTLFDRPLGLYGNRQTAISMLAGYGVSVSDMEALSKQIEPIFLSQNAIAWNWIDPICRQFHIDILVINDLDPLWSNLATLEKARPPLYQNDYYAVFSCGTKNS